MLMSKNIHSTFIKYRTTDWATYTEKDGKMHDKINNHNKFDNNMNHFWNNQYLMVNRHIETYQVKHVCIFNYQNIWTKTWV